jgi:hypothetical protein
VLEPDSYFPIENFFAALMGSTHFDCYSMKYWGGSSTLHCKCWSKDCSLEDNCFGPHSSLALDL